MRAAVLDRFGGPEVLTLRVVPIPLKAKFPDGTSAAFDRFPENCNPLCPLAFPIPTEISPAA